MSSTIELLRSGHSCGAGADDCYFFSGAEGRRLGMDPAFFKSTINDIFFDLFDGYWRLVDSQHAGGFAGRGADTSSELGEIIGGVQLADSFFPASVIDEIVPVGDDVVN